MQVNTEVIARMVEVLTGYQKAGSRRGKNTEKGRQGFSPKRHRVTWGDGRQEIVLGCAKLVEMGIGQRTEKGWVAAEIGYFYRNTTKWKIPKKLMLADGSVVFVEMCKE